MLNALKISATALVLTAVAATSALAGGEPWLEKRPDMTEAQLKTVKAADKLRQKLPEGGFGQSPEDASWDWRRGLKKKMPLSNVQVSDLRRLASGKYRIMEEHGVSIQWLGNDGAAFNCVIKGSRVKTEKVYWAAQQSRFGLSGLRFDKDKNSPYRVSGRGLPVVADAESGLVYLYGLDKRGKVYPRAGWIQEEIPAVALEVCKGMPNNGKVNTDQVSGKFKDLLKHAKPVKGFKVAFKNDPKNPATAGMLYHFYKPKS